MNLIKFFLSAAPARNIKKHTFAMKKILALMVALCMVVGLQAANKKKEAQATTGQFRYDIEFIESAAEGMVMVKVWSQAKKPELAMDLSAINAVHGVLFKGYVAANSRLSHRPIVKDPVIASTKKDFFDQFFANDYRRYVINIVDGRTEVKKVGKEYKVAQVVTVNKDMLRKHLEQAGIIKGLSAGF